MEGIQNALMKRYAKQKLQELIGGGQASNKNDAQSMVSNLACTCLLVFMLSFQLFEDLGVIVAMASC
jgi:hypothetical protein